MVTEKIGTPAGFRVIHESDGWRMAYHAYKKEVNSLSALKKWGVHVDSDEAFVLLKGSMLLATSGTLEHGTPVKVEIVQPGQMYCVEKGEKHALVLTEDSVVLIMENRDMSNFIETDIDDADLKVVETAYSRL